MNTLLEVETACQWAVSTAPDERHHGYLTMTYNSRVPREISFNYSNEISFSLSREMIRVSRLLPSPLSEVFVGAHVEGNSMVFSLRGNPPAFLVADLHDIERFLSMTMEIVALGDEEDIDWESERYLLE